MPTTAAVDLMQGKRVSWSDEKHRAYLNFMEATFVRNLFTQRYCALDVCGRSPHRHNSPDHLIKSRPQPLRSSSHCTKILRLRKIVSKLCLMNPKRCRARKHYKRKRFLSSRTPFLRSSVSGANYTLSRRLRS